MLYAHLLISTVPAHSQGSPGTAMLFIKRLVFYRHLVALLYYYTSPALSMAHESTCNVGDVGSILG